MFCHSCRSTPPSPPSSRSLLHQAWNSGPIVIALAAFLFSISTAAVKLMDTRVPTFEVVFLPGIVCFALTSLAKVYFFVTPTQTAPAVTATGGTNTAEAREPLLEGDTHGEAPVGLTGRQHLQKPKVLQVQPNEIACDATGTGAGVAAAAAANPGLRHFKTGSSSGDEESQAGAELLPSVRRTHEDMKSSLPPATSSSNYWFLPAWLSQSLTGTTRSNSRSKTGRSELEPLLQPTSFDDDSSPSVPAAAAAAVASPRPNSITTIEPAGTTTPVLKRKLALNSHSLHGMMSRGAGSSSAGSGWTPAGFDSGDGDGCSSIDGDGSSVVAVGVLGNSADGGGGEVPLTKAAAHALWLSKQSLWVSVVLCVLRGALGAASITMLFTSVEELRIKDAVRRGACLLFCFQGSGIVYVCLLKNSLQLQLPV